MRSTGCAIISVDVSSDIGPYAMEVINGDHLARILTETHRPYEENVLRVGVALSSPGDQIVDVGANLGNHAVYWGLAGRTVTAFEPNRDVAEILQRNVERNGVASAVDVRVAALGEARGHATPRQLQVANVGTVVFDVGVGDVPVYPLDEMDVPRVAVLKIDVEGHEAAVLRGADNTLRRFRPFVIVEAGDGDEETRALLAGLGYRRVPLSLAVTPTYLHAPSAAAAARALATRPLRRLALGMLRDRARDGLQRR
jgi:FkbM family methyltransferase